MTPAPLSIGQRDELAAVGRCANALTQALVERDEAIRFARASGLSLRQIADVARMTASGIKLICDREPS